MRSWNLKSFSLNLKPIFFKYVSGHFYELTSFSGFLGASLGLPWGFLGASLGLPVDLKRVWTIQEASRKPQPKALREQGKEISSWKKNYLLEKIIILAEEGNYFSKIVNYRILCLLKNTKGPFSNKHITTNNRFYMIVLNKFKFSDPISALAYKLSRQFSGKRPSVSQRNVRHGL